MSEIVSASSLKELLDLYPDSGRVFWMERHLKWFTDGEQSASHACKRWNSRFAGREAFTAVDSKGYRHGVLFGRSVRAHRVIWAMANGRWPAFHVDHINGNPLDNRPTNLREATNAANMRNASRSKNNTSGVTGVSWNRNERLWVANIKVDYKAHFLGSFERKSDAIEARRAAERRFGFHENHGRIPQNREAC